MLVLAEKIVDDVGYKAAQGLIDTCVQGLKDAKIAGDAAVNFAIGAVDTVVTAQKVLVQKARDGLHDAQTKSDELATSNQAKENMDNKRAELQKGVDQAAVNLTNVVKEVVNDVLIAAKDALQTAKAGTAILDGAEDFLQGIETADDGILDAAAWLNDKGANVLNIRRMEINGDLRGICNGVELDVRIIGTITETNIDWSLKLKVNNGDKLIKALFDKIFNDVKGGILSLKHRPGWVKPLTRQEKSQAKLGDAAAKLSAQQQKISGPAGPRYATARLAQRAASSISSAQSSSAALSDFQLDSLTTFSALATASNNDYAALVKALPTPNPTSSRIFETLGGAYNLMEIVNPWHANPADHSFEVFPSASINDWQAANTRIMKHTNSSNTTSAQIDLLEKFINQYDGVHVSTVHLADILGSNL